MLFLRLMGAKMAGEAPLTAGGATRELLGAIGFILLLLGGEKILEGKQIPLGGALCAAGGPIFFAGVFWRWLQDKLSTSLASRLNAAATEPFWWVGTLFALIAASYWLLGEAATHWDSAPWVHGLWPIFVALAFLYVLLAWRKLGIIKTANDSGRVIDCKANPQNERDLLLLLDFSVYQTTLEMLSRLVADTPPAFTVDIAKPFPPEHANATSQADAELYMRRVRQYICDGSDRASRYYSLIQSAEHEAVNELKSTPPQKRPEGIDPLILREYAIAYRQAVRTAAFLRYEQREIQETVIRQRSILIEQFRSRHKS